MPKHGYTEFELKALAAPIIKHSAEDIHHVVTVIDAGYHDESTIHVVATHSPGCTIACLMLGLAETLARAGLDPFTEQVTSALLGQIMQLTVGDGRCDHDGN